MFIYNNSVKSYIVIYVDDIIIACNAQKELNNLEKALLYSYNLTDLGKVKEYSGIQVHTDENGIYYVHQRKHIKQIVEAYGLQDARKSNIPLSVGYENIEDHNLLINNKDFRSLIGSLMYTATSTRPDIIASVAILSRKLNKPTETGQKLNGSQDTSRIQRTICVEARSRHEKRIKSCRIRRRKLG